MKMLVCVSAKQHTSDVVTFACRLARESASEVIILHVQPEPWSHSKGYLEEREKEGLSAAFAEFPDHLGQFFELPCRHMKDAGVEVIPRLEESDDPSACILRVAEEEDVDLIICGATVHRMVERLFQPSITARLIQKSTCPVLVVPHPGESDD